MSHERQSSVLTHEKNKNKILFSLSILLRLHTYFLQICAIKIMTSSFSNQQPVKSSWDKFGQFNKTTVIPDSLTQWHSRRDSDVSWKQLVEIFCKHILLTEEQCVKSTFCNFELLLRTGISNASVNQFWPFRSTKDVSDVLSSVNILKACGVIWVTNRHILQVLQLWKYARINSLNSRETLLNLNWHVNGRHGNMYLNMMSSHGRSVNPMTSVLYEITKKNMYHCSETVDQLLSSTCPKRFPSLKSYLW